MPRAQSVKVSHAAQAVQAVQPVQPASSGCGLAWREVPSTTIFPSVLADVAALSSDNAWAVGGYPDGAYLSLALHWDGQAWLQIPTVNPGNSTNLLREVEMISLNDVWGVGSYQNNGSDEKTLTEHWDGVQWSLVPSPNIVTTTNYLHAVSAISSSEVWAVGNYVAIDGTIGYLYTLVQHWDGTQWSLVPSPNPVSNANNSLYDVTVVSHDDVWAVGFYTDTDGGNRTMVLHWDGIEWGQVSSPNVPGVHQNNLYGVSAVTANDVWAVGSADDDTLTMHWDGSDWTIVPSPSLGASTLSAVDARSTNDVWAVGRHCCDSEGTLTMHWDGTQWTIVPSPSPGAIRNYLWGVATVPDPSGDVWAAGSHSVGSSDKALVVRYSDPCITPSPTPTGTPPTLTPTCTPSVTVTGTPPTRTPTRTPTNTPTRTYTSTPIPGCNPTLITIPSIAQASPYPSNILYSGSGSISRVRVQINNLHHTWPDDIDMLLVGPQGQNVLLMSDTGGSLDINQVILTFDDPCPPLPDAGQIVSGCYRPTEYEIGDVFPNPAPQGPYGSTLSVFNGTNPNGTWSLYIVNDAGGPDIGHISNGWCLLIDTNLNATPTPTSMGTLPTSTPTHTATSIPTATNTSTATNTPIATSTRTSTATSTSTSVPTGSVTNSPTLAPTFTGVPTDTSVPTQTPGGATATTEPTNTSIATVTVTPGIGTVTPTVCPIQFTDVPQDSTFYANIRCLACRGIINGYTSGCETGNPCFRPGNNVTRGQLAKIVSNSAGFVEPATDQQYEDVPVGSTFFDFIYRLTVRGYINGYPCGGPGEPCGVGDRPYFRPNANITRGQISKIVSNGAGFAEPAGDQQFEDVLPGSTFYDFIWRLTDRTIMSGYPCGGSGEPCIDPGQLPYFRPGANATRGQASKIVANAFFPDCYTPLR